VERVIFQQGKRKEIWMKHRFVMDKTMFSFGQNDVFRYRLIFPLNL